MDYLPAGLVLLIGLVLLAAVVVPLWRRLGRLRVALRRLQADVAPATSSLRFGALALRSRRAAVGDDPTE